MDFTKEFLLEIDQLYSEKKGLVYLFGMKEEALLSFFADKSGLQESVRFRALRRSQILASSLIDAKGEFHFNQLDKWIDLLQTQGYLFYPEGYSDGILTQHQIKILKCLSDDKALVKKIKRFKKPLCNSWTEDLVRNSLGIYEPYPLSDSQIRVAVLSALLCPLRQNIGSCFATAPAILIQKEQPAHLLEDLYQLLTLGKLKRVFDGNEYAVPLSPSTGMGDLGKKMVGGGAPFWLSPGLMQAAEVGGLIQGDLNLEEKTEKLKGWLDREKEPITVEKFLYNALLKAHGLEAADIEMGEKLEMIQLKSSRLLQTHAFSPASEKIDLVQKCKKAHSLACAAFKGFCDHPLLKVWEFTLASFSEVKMEFSRWNLYTSLGLNHEERGGLGEIIYTHLEEKITQANQEIQKYQAEYEIAFDQVRSVESLLKNAGSQSEIRRLQAEYQSRAYHMQACLDMRNKSYEIGSNYGNLFSFLVKQYDLKFPEYFQEIYDAKMQDVQKDIYDDSPAGFRLVYKHGRSDPASWTLIYSSEQYIEALSDFFYATQADTAAACQWEGGDKEILEITSRILSHIRTPLFLETALQRMVQAHTKGEDKLQAEAKKPWVYTSGGTMTTLLKTYYCRISDLTEESRWVESESELAIFLIDAIKNQSPHVIDPYKKGERHAMLMSSSSHAFSLLPSLPLFQEGWKEEGFTYTWVRDRIFSPMHQFYAQMHLNVDMQQLLIDLFAKKLSPILSQYLHQRYSFSKQTVTPSQFRTHVLECLQDQKLVLADQLDSFLYEMLPIVPGSEFAALVRRLFPDRSDAALEKAITEFTPKVSRWMSAKMLKESAKMCWVKAHGSASSFDLHAYIAEHARFLNLAAPTPLIFADTNWTWFYFGFVVNPGTGKLELWRLDPTGLSGMPMSSWKHWLNGTDKKPWAVYVRPSEYFVEIRS